MAYAAVQRKGKGQTSGATISIGAGDGWATPTSGNLLVVTANSDATVSTPAGYTAGPSVVDGNGAYIFWKVSAGTESTITCTPGASVPIAITCAEYSGNTASPLDVSNSSTVSGSAGTSTTSVSVTTTVDADLIVAAACLHSGLGNMTGGSWSNSFVNQITAPSGGATSADVVTFVGELLSASPTGAYSTAASWTNSASDRQELVIAFKAAATGSSSTPKPLVLDAPPQRTTPVPAPPVLLRNTLQDPPVLTTPSPVVVSTQVRYTLPPEAILLRGSLFDAATPGPIVVTAPYRFGPGTPPIVARNTLVDPPVLTTPQPLVVSGPSVRQMPNPAYLARSSLVDVAAAPTSTPQPLVASGPALWPVPNPAYLSRSSLLDVAVTPVSTPQPLVVSRQPTFPPSAAVVLRGTLVDPPVLTTGSPLVVSQPARPAQVLPVLLVRSSLADAATPQTSSAQPLVPAPPTVKPWASPPVLLRSSLADPVVVVGVATPQPLVVRFPALSPWPYRPLILAGATVCDCTTHRPDTGVVTRPNSGTVTRPDTGIVRDPCC